MRHRAYGIGTVLVLGLVFFLSPHPAAAAPVILSESAATRAASVSPVGPAIAASPNPVAFGDATVGQSANRPLTISNTGDQTLTVTSIATSDPRFTVPTFAPSSIVPGNAIVVMVRYAPTMTGDDSASLAISSNAVNGPIAVALSGRGIAVGAPNVGAGMILFAPTGESAGDQMGISVATAGDVNGDGYSDVVVGAWANDVGGLDAGRAYVYLGGPAPTGQPAYVLEGTGYNANFGTSAASAGDVNGDGYPDIIVGAWRETNGAGLEAGRAYVYFGGPGMNNVPDRNMTGQAQGDHFGVSVASAGDVNGDGYADVIVGAHANDAAGSDGGRAYVYFGGPAADNLADWVLTGAAAFDNFGWSTAGAGDVNGDGFDDVVVGAYANDAGGTDAGRAYVYFGGVTPNTTPDLILTGASPGERFGVDVASAGDVNGDGHPDIIVGADYNSVGGNRAGRAYVFYGGPGADNVPDLVFTGDTALGSFGGSVASAGDANADGFDDLIVGAWLHSGTANSAGRAYLFLGGPGADAIPDQTYTGEAAEDRLGVSVAGAGDVNGDGRDEIVLGAYFNDASSPEAGRIYVVSPTPPIPPVVTAPSSVSGTVGAEITFSVTANASGGGPILSLSAQPHLAGAAFTPNADKTVGAFAWTPSAAQIGTFIVTFTAATASASGGATTTIVVGAANQAPVLTAPASVAAAEGALFSFGVQATDPDGDHVTLGTQNRPVGSVFVDLGNNTGTFTWTPGFGQSGSYTVTFTGQDSRGANAAPKSVAIAVDNVNRAPAASAGGPYAGVVNIPILFDGTASADPDGDVLTYAWAFGDNANGSGPNPQHAYASGGVFTVSLTVGDGALSTTGLATVTVQDVFLGTAFADGGNKTTRLNSGKSETCVQIEPVGGSYRNTSVDLGSIEMISPGTGRVERITAIAGKTTLGTDRDHDGIDEIAACFSKDDLRALFSGLSGGRQTVGVTLEGSLTTGGRFRATLELEIVGSGHSVAAFVLPNPLNPTGTLTFYVARQGLVAVTLFDSSGRLVRTLQRRTEVSAGYHDLTVDGRSDDGPPLSSGIYFYRVESDEGSATGRVAILK